jgi:hypothetical protein
MEEQFPFFPGYTGSAVKKEDVIATLEALVSQAGKVIHTSAGRKIFGGHSFRVEGAQMLARLGMEHMRIHVLSRWAGETILRYAREAPLNMLTQEYRRRALDTQGQVDTDDLRRALAKLTKCPACV